MDGLGGLAEFFFSLSDQRWFAKLQIVPVQPEFLAEAVVSN
jgi:hypothetical protein